MGYQAAEQLRAQGHTVIGVDLKDADVIADLSTANGRRTAATRVLELTEGKLHGAVLAAGIGPGAGADRARLIAQINYLGTVELLTAWRPALAAAGDAKVVALGSNSSTTVPAVPRRAIKALLAGNADRAARAVRFFGGGASALMYAASKIAVARWVRRTAVTADWAGRGIRLNVLAPGAIMTPLLQAQLDSPREGKAVRAFPSRPAASAIPCTWPTGSPSCCPTRPTSCAAASFSSTAAPTPTSGPMAGPRVSPCAAFRGTCGGTAGSPRPARGTRRESPWGSCRSGA